MTEEPPDPFDDVVLDEAFVASATRSEQSADARAADLQRARAAHDERLRQLVADQAALQAERRRAERGEHRRRHGRLYGAAASVALLLVVAVWAMRKADEPPLFLDPVSGEITTEANAPTLGAAASPVPLGTPPAATRTGTTRFIATTPEGAPVAYDPCRPIAVVVNARTMPLGAGDLLQGAIDQVRAATGLVIEVEGTTTEAPLEQRDAYQPERYGDRWAPVLVAWSDPDELPVLDGPVAGFGGSARLDVPDQPPAYVTGQVVLDGPQLAEVLDAVGPAAARAVLLHELGHLVGLDHVEDRDELLYPEAQDGVLGFGPGDRWGLAQLGAGPCVPRL